VASVVLWLYRALMALVVLVAVPVLAVKDRWKAKRRPPWSERFMRPAPPELPRGAVWIHAVSVGEVEVARRLLSELEANHPGDPVVLTVTTATGLELARATLGDRATVVASPVDLPGPVARFLTAAAPRALVLVETELWPEMLAQVGRRRLPILVVNARLSEGSFLAYRRVRRLLAPLLRPISLVLARDATDVERFCALGLEPGRVEVGGNVKYDLVRDETPLDWEAFLPGMTGDRAVLVAGSTMDGEEEMVLDAISRLEPSGARPFLILAPRHPERFDAVTALLADRAVPTIRRSALDREPAGPVDTLLIDTIGELARAYKLADIAFIGGSLAPTGGHNPLEPAVWGVPVLTGPHLFNFEEVYRELGRAGGSTVVNDTEELAGTLTRWLDDPQERQRRGRAGQAVVDANRGATARAARALVGLLR
jgi:3-deoxy-D-manno-octulosonic-acid transferase